MLQRTTYKRVLAGLKRIRERWEEDRRELPHVAPYEIDYSLKSLIESEIRESKEAFSRHAIEKLVQETIEYLLSKGLIAGSPYGGLFFPLPEGTKIPSREELIESTMKAIKGMKC